MEILQNSDVYGTPRHISYRVMENLQAVGAKWLPEVAATPRRCRAGWENVESENSVKI